MIRVREGEHESILTIDDFERRARAGDISPFALVCLPVLTGERFLPARELPIFANLYDPRRDLFRRHFHLGRLPLVTGLLALVCVALFLLAERNGGGVATREVLLAMGAKARARITDEGELWRLLTANLLHRDIVHLGFNLFALLNVGTVLEGVYRRGDYVLLLVVSGLSTMALSTVASVPITVGASGLVFGCLGAAVLFGLRFSELLPLRYRLYFGVVVVGYAAAMFYLGLQRATTDNWGHTGGLVAGLVMGALLEPRLLLLSTAREPARAWLRPWAVALGIIVVTLAAGPLVPRLMFRYEPYTADAFGVVIERPSTWNKGPDPLGSLAFGNGVDALTSLACKRVPVVPTLDEAAQRFVDGELNALARTGSISGLQVDAPTDGSLGGGRAGGPRVRARRLTFSFIASDGPFAADASVFLRGEVSCAFVLAHRLTASPRSIAILDEIRERLHFDETRAERDAKNAAVNHPTSPKALLDLALAHQAAGSVDAARAAFADALAHAADGGYLDRVLVGAARFELSQGGDLQRAQVAAETANRRMLDDSETWLLLADVLTRRGETAALQELLKKAQARFPEDPRVRARASGAPEAP